jgi:polyisoprenyl-teichoic acid--peptidoglycan teichoic acid transferase
MALDVMPALNTASRRPVRPGKHPENPIRYGRDGRFTILLLGSDWRPAGGGERLDTILVMTVDPRTGRAGAVGIPRDMVRVPRARSNGGGDSGGVRINSLYFIYRDASLPHGAVDRRALARFTADVATLLGTEIDAWAMARFGGFAQIVDLLGGIEVDVAETVLDTSYRSGRSFGVHFPRGGGYRLKGDPGCRPYPRACRSALAYARSRKGTMGGAPNSDYRRVERQLDIAMGAVRRVTNDHGAGLALLTLLLRVRRHVYTSLPATPAAAAQLFSLLDGARLRRGDRAVLSPPGWASSGPGLAKYTYQPNLSAIRRFVGRVFPRVKPSRAG